MSLRQPTRRFSKAAFALGLIALLALTSCAAPARLVAVPRSLTTSAEVEFLGDVRYWVSDDPRPLAREALLSWRREQAYLARVGHVGPLPPANFLALSGGSDNGAFAAGLLNGWTAAGTRPTFKMVTGVSTGALIAPMAFLGPEMDDALREAYTTITKRDIYEERSLLSVLLHDGMVDSRPLLRLVERYVDQRMIDRIAEEYDRGRLLMVATTDLDAMRPVVWNLTAVAASRRPEALDLFRKLLVASASIPGIFPPVMIDVKAGGGKHHEMHVDGGAMTQVFLYPPSLELGQGAAALDLTRERNFYLIRNARLDTEWLSVDRSTLPIAARAISSLIHSQGLGDIYRLYATTQRDGITFNLAFIPADFDAPHPEDFDQAYMRALYDVGFRLARDGDPWTRQPPGFDAKALTLTDLEAPSARPTAPR